MTLKPFGIVLAATLAFSQSFEVASVKPNKSADFRPQMQSLSGGRLLFRNVPLKLIIMRAYGFPLQSSIRLSGGPDWINSEKYDIDAKAEAGAVRRGKLMLLLQTLLAERFKLTTHWEEKQLPVYNLIAARGGPKVRRPKIEEKDCPESSNLFAPAPGSDYCHAFFGGRGRGIHGKTVNMADLAAWLENWTDRPVRDKTGLAALFDIDTERWTDSTFARVVDDHGPGAAESNAAVKVLVIDHVERPSGN